MQRPTRRTDISPIEHAGGVRFIAQGFLEQTRDLLNDRVIQQNNRTMKIFPLLLQIGLALPIIALRPPAAMAIPARWKSLLPLFNERNERFDSSRARCGGAAAPTTCPRSWYSVQRIQA